MLRLGCHLSMSKGYLAMGKEAVSVGANTFQYFSRNPRGNGIKPFDEADAKAFTDFAGQHDIRQVLTHAPYILNPAAKTEELRNMSLEVMKEDVKRLEFFPEGLYNFHPGSHVQQGADVGIHYIAELLNNLIDENQKTVVLLETMAGKGSECGRTFEELRQIMDLVEASKQKKLGVCMDTCHISDGGYDIVRDLEGVLHQFDTIIGLNNLYALHLNDSKNPLGAHKDRHEKIGEGSLGIETFRAIVNHPVLKTKPMFLETPQDLKGYEKEIALLRSLEV